MRFDLVDLRLFVAVVRRGSITAGAAAVHLALASASQRIAAMEASLGAALLVRAARGVTPTEAGLVLLRHAEGVLSGVERMRDELRGFSAGVRGSVRLLSNTGGLIGLAPRLLGDFLRAHPGLDIALEEHSSVEIVRQVTEHEAELGIIADVVDAGDLILHRLAEDRLVALLPAGHAMAGRAAVAFAEVMRERLVGLLDAALERHLEEHAARRGVRLSHRVRLRGVRAVGRLVEAGVGPAILPVSAVAELPGLAVAAVPLSDGFATRQLALCLRDPATLSAPARVLFAHMREAVAPAA